MRKLVRSFILGFLSMLLLLSSLFLSASAEESGIDHDLKYVITEGQAIITGTTQQGGEVTIPAEIQGYPVTSILSYAFANTTITAIQIPESVVYIGSCAFYNCAQLTRLQLPSSLSYLGNYAFWKCSSLLAVDFPQGIQTVPVGAFCYCTSLKTVTLPGDVTEIAVSAFQYCESLTDLTLSENLKKINISAFEGCTGLAALTLPSTLSEICSYAFASCTSLQDIAIPPSVTVIGTGAFARCTSMRSVSFPKVLPWALTASEDVVISSCAFGYTYEESEGERTNWTPVEDFTISCWVDTGAYIYAKRNDISVLSLGGSHSWSQGQVTTVATATSTGLMTYTCTRCGDLRTEVLPKLTENHSSEEENADQSGSSTETAPPVSQEDTSVPGTTTEKNSNRNNNSNTTNTPTFTDVPDWQYFYAPVNWAVAKGVTNGTSATTFSPDQKCTRGQIVTFLWRAAGEPEPTISNPFTDVPSNQYYYKAVLWAYENGITTGTSATTFSPNQSCTRGQIVTFLWRYANEPDAATAGSFTDVATGQYYTSAVYWAVANSITNGMTDTTFAPNQTCTRAQAVTFLYRYMK